MAIGIILTDFTGSSFLTFSPDRESDITTKSNKLRKGLHLNKNSIKHRKDNKANGNQGILK